MNELTMVVFIVLGFGGWRLASMLANESGPFRVFERGRALAAWLQARSRFLQAFCLTELIECEWCNSVWIGGVLVLLWLRFGVPVVYVSLVLAISTVAIIVKYIVQNLELMHDRQETELHPLTEVQVHSLDEVLR